MRAQGTLSTHQATAGARLWEVRPFVESHRLTFGDARGLQGSAKVQAVPRGHTQIRGIHHALSRKPNNGLNKFLFHVCLMNVISGGGQARAGATALQHHTGRVLLKLVRHPEQVSLSPRLFPHGWLLQL